MLEAWVAADLDPARFWDVTPAEFQAALRGADERDYRALRRAQALAYSQTVMMISGWHNPKARMTFDKVFPDPKAKAVRKMQTQDEMIRELRRWTTGMPN